MAGMGFHPYSIVCTVAGSALGFLSLPFILGWLGAGDVKLMGALGAILGSAIIPRVAFYSVLAGGLLALFALVGKKFKLRGLTSVWLDFKLLIMTKGTVLPEVSWTTEPERLTYGSLRSRNRVRSASCSVL